MTQLKVWWAMKYLCGFKGLHKILMKEERITVEDTILIKEPKEHHQHGANWGHAPHGKMQRTQRCFRNIPAKGALFLPNSSPGETSSQTKTEGHSTQVWAVVFKSVKDIKIKEEMELLQTEGARRDRAMDAQVTLNWIPLLRKCCFQATCQNLTGAWGLDGSDVSMLVS